MAKPKAVRVKSDDCLVTLDGVEYAIHEGEWVEVMLGMTVAEYQVQSRLARLQVDVQAADKPETQAPILARAEETIEEVMRILKRRIIGWSWTDDHERPYPNPPTEDALHSLRLEEMGYLLTALLGQNTAARKNGLRPSQTTSSVTP